MSLHVNGHVCTIANIYLRGYEEIDFSDLLIHHRSNEYKDYLPFVNYLILVQILYLQFQDLKVLFLMNILD